MLRDSPVFFLTSGSRSMVCICIVPLWTFMLKTVRRFQLIVIANEVNAKMSQLGILDLEDDALEVLG